jgi:hypothetical protein
VRNSKKNGGLIWVKKESFLTVVYVSIDFALSRVRRGTGSRAGRGPAEGHLKIIVKI